jgi:putative nucleotidyltransferase with HDIG domain
MNRWPEPSSDNGAEAPAVLPADRFTLRPLGGRAGAITPLEPGDSVRLSEVVSALSYALDITEGQPMGHAVRTTLIGMRLADRLGLAAAERSALYYALLLKDLGCSSNAARLATLFGSDDQLLKHAFKLTDWTATKDAARYAFKYSLPGRGRVAKAWHMLMMGVREQGAAREMMASRCERGADIARMLRLPHGSAAAIHSLDEHWDGSGLPFGLKGSAIPLLGRIVSLAQTLEVFVDAFDVRTGYEMAYARRGRWFDPTLVDCLGTFQFDSAFWGGLRSSATLSLVAALEPEDEIIRCDDAQLDLVSEAFARVIDAKSPYTSRHSINVSKIAVDAGHAMGIAGDEMHTLRRASLLHDIGKLGVSNRVLDKPGPLDPDEWNAMRSHTKFTLEILKRVARFRQFAATAAAHHERLDGSGYHLGLRDHQLGTIARLIAVADVTEAISAHRPYRAGLPIDEARQILRKLVQRQHLCPIAVEALEATYAGLPDDASPTAPVLVAVA